MSSVTQHTERHQTHDTYLNDAGAQLKTEQCASDIYQGKPRSLIFNRLSESTIQKDLRDLTQSANSKIQCLTSSLGMAKAYVELLMAFWLDNQLNKTLAPNEPLYILELCAGTGVLSHAIVSQLFAALPHSPFKHLKPVLIITDAEDVNLDLVQQHPKLAPYIARGQVDFAQLDPESFNQIPLKISDITLSKQHLGNPLAVIANHVFSGLHHDLICVHYGQLFEGFVAVEENWVDEAKLPTPVYEWRTLPDDQRYRYPESLLDYYSRYLDSSPILIPTGAIKAIAHLRALSSLPLLILSADIGDAELTQLRQQKQPDLVRDADGHIGVNYHALGLLAQETHGKAHVCQHHKHGLTLSMLIYADSPHIKLSSSQFTHCEHAFNRTICQFSPDDADILKGVWEHKAHQLTPEQMLTLLRINHWDHQLLELFWPHLIQKLSDLSDEAHNQWQQAALQIWRYYYPVQGHITPSYQLGSLAIELGLWGMAKSCFEDWLQHANAQGDNTRQCLSHFNLAWCYLYLGNAELANQHAKQALCLVTHASPLTRDNVTDPLAFTPTEQHCQQLLDSIRQIPPAPEWYSPEVFSDGQLSLQPLAAHHCEDMFYQLRDPTISIMTRLPNFESVQDIETWLKNVHPTSIQKNNHQQIPLAIIHPQFGFIGSTALRCANNNAFFYFWIGTDYQGKGYGPKSVKLLTQAAFQNLAIKRFFTTVYSDNHRSLTVLQAAGWHLLPFMAKDRNTLSEQEDERIYCLIYDQHYSEKSLNSYKTSMKTLLVQTQSALYIEGK